MCVRCQVFAIYQGDMFFDNGVWADVFFGVRIDSAHNQADVLSNIKELSVICEFVFLNHFFKLLHNFGVRLVPFEEPWR